MYDNFIQGLIKKEDTYRNEQVKRDAERLADRIVQGKFIKQAQKELVNKIHSNNSDAPTENP